jgi:O-antigen ligase
MFRSTAGPAAAPSALLANAAIVTLALLPLVMALANRSATAVIILAAVLALSGAVIEDRGIALVRNLAVLIRTPPGIAALAFAALAMLSVTWSRHSGLSLFALGEALLPAVASLCLAAGLPRAVPRRMIALAVAAYALAAVVIMADLATGLAVRKALGLRAADYVFNRPVITLVILYGPLAALLWRMEWRRAAVGLGALLSATLVSAVSGAAVLGAAAGALAVTLAFTSRRLAFVLVGAGLFAALALAPVKGELAGRLLPDRLVTALSGSHARERMTIWRDFEAVVWRRPLLGTGFGASPALAADPVAAEVPPERRTMLAAGHPHDAYLQIWTELGAAGAALAGVALALLLRAAARQPPSLHLPCIWCLAAAGSIMLVGHGAWQGWWIADLGAAALWLGISPAKGADPYPAPH